MTADKIQQVLERVRDWPPERQADLAQIAELMEEQDRSPVRLSDEQAAEVRHRIADPDRRTIPLAEFNRRLKERYGV